MNYFKPKIYKKRKPRKPREFHLPRLHLRPPSFSFNFFFPLGLIIGGVIILVSQIVLPLFSFPEGSPLAAPVPEEEVPKKVEKFAFLELEEVRTSPQPEPEKSPEEKKPPPDYFYLSIPKLGIKKAKVETDTQTLDPKDALAHWRGSAYPGEEDNVFIYGHSTFPYLFNPQNYKTIFSTLPNLEKGDQIEIGFSGKKFSYVVTKKETLEPKEVDPTESLNGPYLTLMTCVPPGTRAKRLLVRALLSE